MVFLSLEQFNEAILKHKSELNVVRHVEVLDFETV